MPLITKASRRKAKPAWQKGPKPPSKEQRDSFAISANHERVFANAFNALLRNLMTTEMVGIIRRAIKTERTVEGILSQIPFFDSEEPKTFAIWAHFARKLELTYERVISETIGNEARKRNWKLEFDVRKVGGDEIPPIPINPDSAAFVRNRSLTNVVDLSGKEKERVREILSQGFEGGVRPEEVVDKIQDTVGLTKKQVKMVDRRVESAKKAGIKGRRRELNRQFSNDLRLQRARTIARTETADAMSQGLQDGWRKAEEQGLTPPGTKKRWVAFIDDRVSEICEGLNGEEVGINELFSEGISGPPAHPNCRSTLQLVFPQ